MKRILITFLAMCAFAPLSLGQISAERSSVQTERIAIAANSGGFGYGGAMRVEKMTMPSCELYFLFVETTNEYDSAYPVYLGSSLSETEESLNAFAEICGGKVGETLVVTSPNPPDGGIPQGGFELFDMTHSVTVAHDMFIIEGREGLKGKSIVFTPSDTFRYAGIIGARKSAFKWLLKKIRWERTRCTKG